MSKPLTIEQLKSLEVGDWAWLIYKDTKGYYEVLRAVKADRRNPLIIYKRETTLGGKQLVHLSVFDRDMGIVREFLKENKNERD